jgi:hypothetical protein
VQQSKKKEATPTKNPGPGRPSGKAQRPRITLPDGEVLVPYFTDWSQETGINAKSLQRTRPRMPTVVIAGVVYVKDRAGRQVLAEPKKSRGARR